MANQAILIINSCSVCSYAQTNYQTNYLRVYCTCNCSIPIHIGDINRWNTNMEIPDWCPNLINNKIIINKPKKLKL